VSSPKLLDSLHQLEIEPEDGYTTEINPYLAVGCSHKPEPNFWSNFLIDYGLTQREYYIQMGCGHNVSYRIWRMAIRFGGLDYR